MTILLRKFVWKPEMTSLKASFRFWILEKSMFQDTQAQNINLSRRKLLENK